MPKIAIIYSAKDSGWLSCRAIMSNLKEAYRLAGHADCFNFSERLTDYDVLILAETIADYDQVVFIDHTPHPLFLLEMLFYVTNGSPPEYRFHLYGDFTLNLMEWQKAAPLIKCAEFVCASDRQVALVKQFISNQDSVVLCPFACDDSFFIYSDEGAAKFRSKFCLGNSKIILYAGRLSPEKNIAFAVEVVGQFLEANEDVVFVLAGPFDDLGPQKFGSQFLPGRYEDLVHNTIGMLPEHVRKRIRLVGSLSPDLLVGAYAASQVFFSLSLYHDEDFGMAPVEALLCGLPCILSSWGGYTSFGGTDAVRFVTAELQPTGYYMDTHHIMELLKVFVSSGSDVDSRSDLRNYYKDRFGINGVSQIIKGLDDEGSHAFSGFTNHFDHMCDALHEYAESSSLKAWYTPPLSTNSLYLKTYLPYLGETYG